MIAELTITPMCESEDTADWLAMVIDKIDESGLDYQLTAMGTIIQGPLERVLEIAQKMHEVPFTRGAKRVVTTINIDDRRDKTATMESKVEAVARASSIS